MILNSDYAIRACCFAYTSLFSTVLSIAGIGIMNIIIVFLIERAREIGISKVLVFKSRTVLYIILTELIIIGLIEATIGVASGWGLANFVSIFLGRSGIMEGDLTIMPILMVEILSDALIFGIGIRVIFALCPAWRTSKLKPLEALRYA